MTEKRTGCKRLILICLILLFSVQAIHLPASAGDSSLPNELTGEWILDMEAEGNVRTPEAAAAKLTFGEDGKVSLSLKDRNGDYAYTCEGSWSFEYVPDLNDHLKILFTSTDKPLAEGEVYSLECVYEAYTESWLENDTLITYLILTELSLSDISPFEDVYGEDGSWSVALYREKGPNMRIVKCTDWVSLRETPSKSAARLAKVPLGAKVLAFPENGEKNGFIECAYQNEYGYILAEYLEKIPE